MRRLTPIGALLLLLALPSCMAAGSTSGPAAAAPAVSAAAQCRAERDRRLRALEHEEQTLKTMIDTDAAVIETPEFQLRKTERALMKAVQDDKDAAWARYRACLRPAQPSPPKRR
ncbi:MAG: hypothetical protein OEU46_15255 [Alphaproteobacteria bacterium]|nr:hypothetical protein [Alphaproteobacteria bacterium]